MGTWGTPSDSTDEDTKLAAWWIEQSAEEGAIGHIRMAEAVPALARLIRSVRHASWDGTSSDPNRSADRERFEGWAGKVAAKLLDKMQGQLSAALAGKMIDAHKMGRREARKALGPFKAGDRVQHRNFDDNGAAGVVERVIVRVVVKWDDENTADDHGYRADELRAEPAADNMSDTGGEK